MEIPMIIEKNNRKYKYVKAYSNYILYEDSITKVKECFQPIDLGLIEERGRVVNARFDKKGSW